MKVIITLEAQSPKAAAEILAKIAGATFTATESPAPSAESAPKEKGKPGRKPKPKAEEMEEIEDAEETEEQGEEIEDFDDFSEDEGEEAEDEDEDARIDEEQVAQLKKALHAFSNKAGNTKQKAVKILLGFGKTSTEVKKKDLPKLLKLLKV